MQKSFTREALKSTKNSRHNTIVYVTKWSKLKDPLCLVLCWQKWLCLKRKPRASSSVSYVLFLPDSGSLGLTSSTASSFTCCSSGPWDEWSAMDSFFSFPRPTIFMKDRRRLVESHSLSEPFSSPLVRDSLRELRVSRYFPANLGGMKEEMSEQTLVSTFYLNKHPSSIFTLKKLLLCHFISTNSPNPLLPWNLLPQNSHHPSLSQLSFLIIS